MDSPHIFSQSEESPLKQRKLGLDVNSHYDYDVITVHGIRDDYKMAWTDEQGRSWVKDQLFKNRSVREINYSYGIDEESLLYLPLGLFSDTSRLIVEYAELREKLDMNEANRPIVWICHDLGGTIVKEALTIAARPSSSAEYNKIATLTKAIIFLGTPHQVQSIDELEIQLNKLILLPGPKIENRVPNDAKNLAIQVDAINEGFLKNKLLDRAAIFNVFARNNGTGVENGYSLHDPVTPFPQSAHVVGRRYEAAERCWCVEIDHIDLVRGHQGQGGNWISGVSNIF